MHTAGTGVGKGDGGDGGEGGGVGTSNVGKELIFQRLQITMLDQIIFIRTSNVKPTFFKDCLLRFPTNVPKKI
jgi:hypothetical protein